VAKKSNQKGNQSGSPLEVLLAFGKLGVSCFGGPIAHIGYFREEFVVQRRWLDERLRRSRSTVPIPARTGQQSGRLFHWGDAGRRTGSAKRAICRAS